MINLTNVKEVKAIQGHIRSTFGSPSGEKAMEFLEQACGWYESIFDPADKDRILINAGRREVVATIKTFLNHSPEQIAAMAQQKES